MQLVQWKWWRVPPLQRARCRHLGGGPLASSRRSLLNSAAVSIWQPGGRRQPPWRQRCGGRRSGCLVAQQHSLGLNFTLPSLQDEPADPLMVFAEALRSKGGVECRSGVLNGERVELFRGKDLVRWVKANPAKCAAAAGGERVRGGGGRR